MCQRIDTLGHGPSKGKGCTYHVATNVHVHFYQDKQYPLSDDHQSIGIQDSQSFRGADYYSKGWLKGECADFGDRSDADTPGGQDYPRRGWRIGWDAVLVQLFGCDTSRADCCLA